MLAEEWPETLMPQGVVPVLLAGTVVQVQIVAAGGAGAGLPCRPPQNRPCAAFAGFPISIQRPYGAHERHTAPLQPLCHKEIRFLFPAPEPGFSSCLNRYDSIRNARAVRVSGVSVFGVWHDLHGIDLPHSAKIPHKMPAWRASRNQGCLIRSRLSRPKKLCIGALSW